MFFFLVCLLMFVTLKLSSLSSIWFQVSFFFVCIHWWCSASKWVNPSLPHIPPTILFSPIRSPPPLFPRLYMHLYRDSHSSCAYHVLPLSPPCSLPPPTFSDSFFCYASLQCASLLLQNDPTPFLTHARTIPCICFLWCWFDFFFFLTQ